MVESRRWPAALWAILSLLLLCLVYKLPAWLPFVSGDMSDYMLWMQHILAYGRLHSLAAGFSSYNPPYIYVLSAASLLYPHLRMVFLIKLADLPFLLLGCAAAWNITRNLGADRVRAAAAAGLLFLLPEVMNNCWHWGQTDMLPTAMLLWTAAFAVQRRPYLAMALFGVAVSFKLQAILIAPALLALLVVGYLPWASIVAAAAGYFAMFVPAVMAGRPWNSSVGVYGQQVSEFQKLTMDAPNPYVLVQMIPTRHEELLARLGIAFAGGCALWFIWFTREHRKLREGFGLMLTLTAPLLFMPYLLPRMHERYFFAGDCFLAILAVMRPRLMLPLVLMQVSIFIAYGFCLHRELATDRQMLFPLALSTAALFFVGREIAICMRQPQTLEAEAMLPG